MAASTVFIQMLPFIALISSSTAFSKNHFVGAVYEHPRQGRHTSYSPALVQTNLEYYKRAAKVAKEYGADIILYPEYGLFPPFGRDKVIDYLEEIPNPKVSHVTPCDDVDTYSTRPILHTLSCMAKMNDIVVVANMGGIEYCKGELNCSDDGARHLNANVAFGQNGTLLGRYYKERLYFEAGMDLPAVEQDPTFETNFGRFATFISFDIHFKRMSVTSRLKDIDAVLISAMWVDYSPFYISTQWWQAWAMGNDATLLASNINVPGFLTVGSGIFRGSEAIASTLNPDGVPKLVIANVPKRGANTVPKSTVIAFTVNGTKVWNTDREIVPSTCSYKLLDKPKNIYKDYRCANENVSNYTLVKLKKNKDRLQVCNNGMCCELEYVTGSMSESFYFGVFNGTHIPYMRYPWSEENCFLARCNDYNGETCSEFPMVSKTFFHKLSMKANFSTKYIFPSLMSSNARLVPAKDWVYETQSSGASIDFSSISGLRLLSANLKGRAYDRDPPHQR